MEGLSACRIPLLAALYCVSVAANVCAAPLEPISRRQLGAGAPSSQATSSAPFPDTLTSRPILFNWGFEAVSDDLAQDAALYEEQLSSLLNGPLSDWQSFPRVRCPSIFLLYSSQTTLSVSVACCDLCSSVVFPFRWPSDAHKR